MIEVKVKKLHPNAVLPKYMTEGAAAFDLFAVMDNSGVSVTDSVIIDTGLSFEVPEGHVMLIFSRSGQGFKHDTRLANCVGVIDSDYRGEVKVKLTRDQGKLQNNQLFVRAGQAIAQAMIIPIPKVTLTVVDELSETQRGENGFGSTG